MKFIKNTEMALEIAAQNKEAHDKHNAALNDRAAKRRAKHAPQYKLIHHTNGSKQVVKVV